MIIPDEHKVSSFLYLCDEIIEDKMLPNINSTNVFRNSIKNVFRKQHEGDVYYKT